MRNPLAWIRWLVLLLAIALAVWFVYVVFVRPDQEAPAPRSSGDSSRVSTAATADRDQRMPLRANPCTK